MKFFKILRRERGLLDKLRDVREAWKSGRPPKVGPFTRNGFYAMEIDCPAGTLRVVREYIDGEVGTGKWRKPLAEYLNGRKCRAVFLPFESMQETARHFPEVRKMVTIDKLSSSDLFMNETGGTISLKKEFLTNTIATALKEK